jgi:hypothetical protein
MKTSKTNKEKNRLTTQELNKLATTHDQHCVSVYVPPTMNNGNADDPEGQLKLKNIIKHVRHKLLEHQMGELEVEGYLEPFRNLLGDASIWRNRKDTLAVFLNDQRLKHFLFSDDMQEKIYVSDHFYLLPLIPILNETDKFLLLTLSLQDVKLFKGDKHGLSALHVDGLLPEKLEDAVGYDYREKSLQFRTGKGGDAGAIFHGQGAGKDDKQKEIEKFFRAIDKGLSSYLDHENLPLVLACVDEHYPVYAQITKYTNLYPKHISGNVENVNMPELHQQSWSIIEPYFKQGRKEAREAFREFSASEKTSIELLDIIPATIEGRVDVLFVQNGKDRRGLYDTTNHTLMLDENMHANQVSLFNLAAVQTWLNGGRVFIETPVNMPFVGSEINALFRY